MLALGQGGQSRKTAWLQQWHSAGRGWETAQARKREGWMWKAADAREAWVAGLLQIVVDQCLPLRHLVPVL